ncbi:MAG: sigma-E factor negative regulatory protein [Burkholderiales bacterium]|nr:sigma-E factor negative regulatory protein [Burkholderiales bacterium]
MKQDRDNRDRTAASQPPDGTDDCAQRLSALLDGELDAEGCGALVERLRRDEAACRTWAMLSCVGDALRSSEVASFHSDGFVARVSAALDREPTVLAPAALPARPAVRRWLLPGAGAAVAAAVLLAVGLPQRQQPSSELAVVTVQPSAAPVAAKPDGPPIKRSPQLERYLAAHRELAAPTVMPSSIPYVRTSGAVPMQEVR